MPRKQPAGLSRFFRRVIDQLLPCRSDKEIRKTRRHLKFEPLEGRQLLASDLASLTGVVSLTNPVENATINLYLDDGDGVFEGGGEDGSATTDTTDASGVYRFDHLVAGNYWLEQPVQTVGTDELGLFRKLVTISAADAAGTAGTVIDDFGDSPAAEVESTSGTVGTVADHAGSLGGERDMIVTLKSGTTSPSVKLTSTGNQLIFDSSFDAQGLFNVIYDGDDDDATTLDPEGLAPTDLTQAGANAAIKIRAQADLAGATVRLRVYTDADHFSESAAVVIPEGNVPEDIVFHFATSFTGATGTGGPADFTDVGAIDLLVETNTDGTDGLVTLLGAFAPNVVTENITNELDMSVVKEVNDTSPGNNEAVTFTITVMNTSATQTATNVVLTDTFDFTTLSNLVSTPETESDFTLAGDNLSGTWTIPSLAPGVTATLTITGNNISGAQRTNAIALTSLDQIDTNAANDGDSVELVPVTLDLVVDKQVNDATPNNGQSVEFTITVTNSSATEAATNVVLTDTFDFTTLSDVVTNAETGTTFVIAGDNQSGTWTIPTLAAGATATLTITGNNNSSAQRTNAIALTSLDQFDTDNANNSDSQQLTPVTLDLVVDKQVNDNTPTGGQPITFTMTVTNTSATEAATNVVLTDTFDFTTLTGVISSAETGTTFVIAGDNQSGAWTIPSLAPGATATLTITGNNNSAATRTNTIVLTSLDQFDSNTDNNSDSVQLTATGADLSITNTPSSATPNFGSNVTFTIVVTNSGPDQATGVVVTDLLPVGLAFDSSSVSQGSYVSGTGVWTVGTINNGSNATLTLVARVNTTAAIDNVAQVTASGVPDPDSTPNDGTGDDRAVATVDAPAAADLRLAKSASSGIVIVGQQVTFTLTLTNDGPDAATGVTVTDLLPAGLSFESSNPSQGTYISATGVWDVGTVNNGANATLSIVATLTTAGAKTNTAQVTASNEFDPDSTPNDNAGDDRATVSVTSARLSKRFFLAR